MSRPTSLSLRNLALLVTLPVSAAASPGVFENYDWEAPPPELGPPGAVNALRDKSQLPWEICGIVGAYLVTVFVALTLLLTVGRRLRRDAERSPVSLEIEMIKTIPQTFDMTPISPASTTRTWIQKAFKKTPSVKSDVSNPTSPAVHSVASFDHHVIQNDMESRQNEMERLYAAVMQHQEEQEARKSQQSVVTEREVRSSHEPRKPLQINTASAQSIERFPSPQSATSPRSPYRAIHPPDSARTARFANEPEASRPVTSPYGSVASPRKEPPMSPGKTPLSPRNFLSRHSRQSSQTSSSSKTRKALRNLRISAPMQKYPNDNDDEARTPLSPRFYDPPPPPSLPSEANTPHARTPVTAGTYNSDYAHEALDEPAPLPMPRANPHRLGSTSGPLSPPPQISVSPSKSAASSTSTLPLRSYHDQHGITSLVPPTPTKTTYVERRKERLGINTPRTGVPATPYSPYMPYTPITPVTPHLVSKRERKEKKKIEGKRVMNDDDMVKEDSDMW